jgi:glycosyltransferase involved in cell wall biosynthesis
MRGILLDITRLLDRGLQERLPTGVDRVILEYVRHFRDQARALVRFGGRKIVVGREDSRRLFDALLNTDTRFNSTVRWLVGRSYVFRWAEAIHEYRLFNIGHSGLDRPDYRTFLQRNRLQPIFFLHDLIPITHPEYCRDGEAGKHTRRLETMLDLGRGLIVNSEYTRNSLEEFTARTGRRLPSVVVAPLAPGRLPLPGRDRPLAAPYFVVLGTVEPRKNHLLLLHLWRQLALEYGEAAPRLVIIGQRGWECEQVVDMLERCAPLSGHVMELSSCGDQELSTWLRHACALLFPSFAEGFGMPLVEAMALKLPVIASDLPVLHESGGNIPEYLDPLDGRAWRDTILEYARPDSAKRQAQCLRLEGFTAPTWEGHFSKVEEQLGKITCVGKL